jgi:hypothetical protein
LWKVGSDPFGLSDSSAEKRENLGWDLFSLYGHFAEPAGAILLFRFRQRSAADNYPLYAMQNGISLAQWSYLPLRLVG